MRSFMFLALLAAVAPPVIAQTPRTIADVGLEGSECARYDAADDRYIVANLGPRGPDANGFLSIMSPEGAIEMLKWIDGAAAGANLVDPLGFFIHGDRIYVADTATLRIYDRHSGAPVNAIPMPGAARLNDVAVAKDGTVYVTDSGSDTVAGAIYRITPRGKASLFAPRDAAVERVNGIAVMADGTVVHGGRGVNLVFRNPAGKIVREQTLPTGRMDGIVALPDGALLVASQDGHVVYHVAPAGGAVTTVAKDIEVPAAIGYDPKRKRLIIPQIRAASVTFVDLSGSL